MMWVDLLWFIWFVYFTLVIEAIGSEWCIFIVYVQYNGIAYNYVNPILHVFDLIVCEASVVYT